MFALWLLPVLVLVSCQKYEFVSLAEHSDTARCNDDSPVGFYIRKGQSVNWHIHLQGGGFCFSKQSCQQRSRRLMSSTQWPADIGWGPSGALSASPRQNPLFHNWTTVFMPYCTSDSWSGTANSSDIGWSFLGHQFFAVAIKHMQQNLGLGGASVQQSVVLSGSSAGAEGLLPNIDWLAKRLAPLNVVGLADSGWFLDSPPFRKGSCSSLSKCTEQGGLERGVSSSLWRSFLPSGCYNAHPGSDSWKCMMAHYAAQFIETPMFYIQYLFDQAQMGHDGIYSSPTSGPSLRYAEQSAHNLTASFHADGVRAVFSPACYHHTILTNPNWLNVTINGSLNVAQAFQAWRSDPQSFYPAVDGCVTPNCNPTCLSLSKYEE